MSFRLSFFAGLFVPELRGTSSPPRSNSYVLLPWFLEGREQGDAAPNTSCIAEATDVKRWLGVVPHGSVNNNNNRATFRRRLRVAALRVSCIRLRFQRSHTVPCVLVGFTWEQECRRHAPLGSLRQRTHACTAMGVHHHVQQWLTRTHTHTQEGITAHACTNKIT